jgi:hypothetical protein
MPVLTHVFVFPPQFDQFSKFFLFIYSFLFFQLLLLPCIYIYIFSIYLFIFLVFSFLFLSMIHDKKVPLNLYEIIDDHIIFTNVVSNKNTDFQLYIFWGVKCFLSFLFYFVFIFFPQLLLLQCLIFLFFLSFIYLSFLFFFLFLVLTSS